MQRDRGKQMFAAWLHLLHSLQPDRIVLDERGRRRVQYQQAERDKRKTEREEMGERGLNGRQRDIMKRMKK